jgi:very-short-patch-repair endonuclease
MKTFTQIARKLRKRMTPGEICLWQKIRRNQLGFKVRRPHPIPPFVVDFYVQPISLIIEIDRSSHDASDQIKKDKARQEMLESWGFTVILFSESQARNNTDLVTAEIQNTVDSLMNNNRF